MRRIIGNSARSKIPELFKKVFNFLYRTNTGVLTFCSNNWKRFLAKWQEYFIQIVANVFICKQAANASVVKFALLDTLINVRTLEWTSPIAVVICFYHLFKIWRRGFRK